MPTKVERSLYRGITGITGITGTSNTGNTEHKYIGGNTDFVPKEGIFLLFISYTFLTRLGDISGNFFAH